MALKNYKSFPLLDEYLEQFVRRMAVTSSRKVAERIRRRNSSKG